MLSFNQIETDLLKVSKKSDILDFFRYVGYIFQQEHFWNNERKNILIVRLDSIGDQIIHSGFIREVRRNFPESEITLIVSPIVYPVVENCPYVKDIYIFDKDKPTANFSELIADILSFCKFNLWDKQFGFAFSTRWAEDTIPELFLCYLSGARERIGYGTFPYFSWIEMHSNPVRQALDSVLLTRNLITSRDIITDAERNFYVLSGSGFDVLQNHAELWYTEKDRLWAAEKLLALPMYCKRVVIGLGGSKNAKKYPAHSYLTVLSDLLNEDYCFILVGAKHEIEDADFLVKNLPTSRVLNLVDKTTVPQVEAVISQCDYYIGNDTSHVHMAAANHIPCVVMYCEPSDKLSVCPPVFSGYSRFTPYQTHYKALLPEHALFPCSERRPIHCWCHADKPHCITQISPAEVIDNFKELVRDCNVETNKK